MRHEAVVVVDHGRLPPLEPPLLAPAGAGPTVAEHRRCWIDGAIGWADVPVYAGATMGPGHRYEGPSLVDAHTTTVLGLPGDHATVGRGGDLLIEWDPT